MKSAENKVERMKVDQKKDGVDDSLLHLGMKEAVATAKTVEDLWAARWKVWHAEYLIKTNRPTLDELRRAEGDRDELEKEGSLLGELRLLRRYLGGKRGSLEKIQKEIRQGEAGKKEDDPGLEVRLRHAVEKVDIYQKAYDASRAAAGAFFPERASTPDSPEIDEESQLRKKVQEHDGWIQRTQADVEEIRAWVSRLPEDTDRARKLAQDKVNRYEGWIESYTKTRHNVVEAIEKCGLKRKRE
ncbi:hypothetical protein IMZ48_05175 [Candidatus Bathyarchaeota archaeon]|nr:hypothetical protein [Candidatus Bathyarchaeota archaeon]